MKRRSIWLIALGSALALLLAACGGAAPKAGKHKQAASQTFTYDTYTPVMIDGWDPATEYSNGIIAMSNMYETLTRYNTVTHKVGPLLATSWSSTHGGLTWTFQLRHGVHFHTGRLLTAPAAKAAILRTAKLNGGAAYIWGAVKTIDTPGTYTLVFHLKYPAPLDLEASADYSAYIYDTKAAGSGDLAKWLNAPHDAGTGPYTIATWNKGQEFEVVEKAYPKYWGGWSGAHFKRVVFRVVPQDTTAAQLLRTGQVSFVEQLSPSLWKSLRGAAGIRLMSAPSWQNLLGQLNSKALSLPERQAISYGINYRGIIAALQGAGVPSSGIVPAGLLGHFSDLPNYSYDPAKATQLLNQVGYGPGKKRLNLSLINLSYYSNRSLDSQINKVESLVATNRTAGDQLYRSMQVTILRQAPIAFLYNANYQYAMTSNFSGLQVNQAYPNVVFAYNLKPLGS